MTNTKLFQSLISPKKFAHLSRLRKQRKNADAEAEAENGIEVVEGVRAIRLKARKKKYLTAGSDEESVRVDKNGSSEQALWTIEFVDGKSSIRIKSCYGKYLTATNEPVVPKSKGHKVLQTLPDRLNPSTEWEIEREGNKLRFRTSYGKYLRPYGGLPPFRNMVGHDVPCRPQTEEKILWELVVSDGDGDDSDGEGSGSDSDSDAQA